MSYGEVMEAALRRLESLLSDGYGLSKRAIALLLLQDDREIADLVRENDAEQFDRIAEELRAARERLGRAPAYRIAVRRQEVAEDICADAECVVERRGGRLAEKLSELTMNPITGIPILLVVLYVGLYLFVGVFGAGVLVDWLENGVFGAVADDGTRTGYISPWTTDLVTSLIPSRTWQGLFVGDYGIITLGLKYAVAIIIPIVGCFFLMFSLLEDTGYLPRLALLIDRVMKRIGLSGRAVIPMALGFGCDTMATIVTRTLETPRERTIATLLLALAIPCSAQLGVFAAVLSSESPWLVFAWALIVALEFLLVGWLSGKLMPGKPPSFYMEVPPLRLPKISNVLAKTFARMHWYFVEVLPLFVLASVLLWLGNLSWDNGEHSVFKYVVAALAHPARALGFGEQSSGMAEVFLFGFFRRDYSAAHLFDLAGQTHLTHQQLLVGAVTLTLFVPCIAQFIIMLRERGWRIGLLVALFSLAAAFVTGFLLNQFLSLTRLQL
ncbi:MAG: nucleoside recognition domain-containing protein [Armatimonadota bacterium]